MALCPLASPTPGLCCRGHISVHLHSLELLCYIWGEVGWSGGVSLWVARGWGVAGGGWLIEVVIAGSRP